MKVFDLIELLDTYGNATEVKIEVRGEIEEGEVDGTILDITDERSVYLFRDGTVHIIGDVTE